MRCGVIANAYFNQPDGWYYVDGIIWDDKAQDLINKGWSVSCSYDYLAFNDEGGEENNIHYDKEFTQLNFTHLAIVDNPRYERANIVFNNKINNEEKDEDIQWITVKGNHIPVKKGQTKEDAIEEFLDKQTKKQNDEKIKKIKDLQQQHKSGEKFKIRDIYGTEEHTIKEITKSFFGDIVVVDERGYQHQIDKVDFGDTKGKQSDTKEKQPNNKNQLETENLIKISKDEERKYRELANEFAKQGKEIDKKIYEEAADFEQNRQKMLQDRIDKNNYPEPAKSSGPKSSVDKEDIERTFRRVIGTGRNSEETAEILATDIFEKLPNKFSKQEQEATKKIKEHIDEYLMSEYDKKTPEDVSKIKISSDKHFKHFTSSLFISQVNEILEKNNINNSKEQDMAIIEELKKLIFKVENNKENETMVENEKVDKRKLIDEVAGIMKSAGCDDEDIRTAIGKMEKIGYDDSEASADNKKVKNEADEEDKKVDNEEDKKEEDKKVDNEDDKEEDKEKAEDLKEEEKKDVENKCKNSVGNAKGGEFFDKINKIYNSAKKIDEPSVEYESKQARLDAGKEYFG